MHSRLLLWLAIQRLADMYNPLVCYRIELQINAMHEARSGDEHLKLLQDRYSTANLDQIRALLRGLNF